MREYGEVRFRFVGGDDLAKRYIGIARTQLGLLKNFMRAQGLQQLSRRIFLADGTGLVLASIFGIDIIEIDVTSQVQAAREITGGEVITSEYQIAVDIDDGQGLSMIKAWSFDPNVDPAPGLTWMDLMTFLGIPAPPNFTSLPAAALVAKAGKITRLVPALDPNSARVDAAHRAAARGDFGIAELILRNMEWESSNASSSTPLFDGALNCDEGFFVDPSVYGNKPYVAKINSLLGKYISSFAHDPIPPPATNLFPEIDFTQYDNTQYVGYSYASRQWSYVNAGVTVVVNQLNYVNAGTVSVQPNSALGITPFSIPLGTTVTHKMATVVTDFDFPPSNPYADVVDRIFVQRLHYREDYYTVSTDTNNGDGTWTIRADHNAYASPLHFPSPGPVTGYAKPRALWIKQRRTPSGWAVKETIINASASISPFTLDAVEPGYGFIASPNDSSAESALEQTDGTLFNFATQTWLGSDISAGYSGFNPGAGTFNAWLGGNYFVVGWEPFGPYGASVHLFYPVVHPAPVIDSADAAAVPQKIFSRKGKVFSLNLDQSITIVDNTKSPVVTQKVAAQPGQTPPRVEAIEHLEYTYPPAADYTSALLAARLNLEMLAYVPTVVQKTTVAPPTDFVSIPIYDCSTGLYLVYQLNGDINNDPVFQQAYDVAFFGTIIAYAFNQPSEVKAQYLNQLLALVTVVADGGLPHEAIIFSSAGNPTMLV